MEDEVVLEANMQYARQLLDQAGSLSLDLARSVLTSYTITAAKARTSGRRRLAGGYIQCPRCNTPRISNLVQFRLLGRPHCLHTLKRNIRKEMTRPYKLTSMEKRVISAFRCRENRVEVTCLVCRHKMRESFTVPEREKVAVPEVVKKKKKKSVKELNAGLFLPSRGQDSSSNADCRIPRKSEVPPVNISEQSSLVKKNAKPPRKTFEKKPKEAQTVSKISEFEKSLSKRVEKSLPRSSHLGNTVSVKTPQQHSVAQNLHSIGLQAQSLVKADSPSFKTKQAERKQLLGLKNVMMKEVSKSSSKQQKSSLGDFLSTLF